MSRAHAKIHIAKKELGIHDDDYRDLLERVTGARSSSNLSDRQIGAVLDEFKRLGWKPRVVTNPHRPSGTSPANGKREAANFEGARKCRALWISLWQLGAIRNRSEDALEAFAKRQLGVEVFAWADPQQVYKLTEALKSMAERKGWSTKAGQSIEEIKRNLIRAQCQLLNEQLPLGLSQMGATELTEIAKNLGLKIQGLQK